MKDDREFYNLTSFKIDELIPINYFTLELRDEFKERYQETYGRFTDTNQSNFYLNQVSLLCIYIVWCLYHIWEKAFAQINESSDTYEDIILSTKELSFDEIESRSKEPNVEANELTAPNKHAVKRRVNDPLDFIQFKRQRLSTALPDVLNLVCIFLCPT